MRTLALIGLGVLADVAVASSAYAIPIKIQFSSNAFPFPNVSLIADSSDLTVNVAAPDPSLGDPGNTYISGDFFIGGPDPGFPSTPTSTQSPGIYTFYQEYDITIIADFPVSDVSNFFVDQSQISYQGSTYSIASYEVFADQTFQVYQDGPTPLTIYTFQVSAVPLPASAPMFGAALLALGAAGYAAKRKGTTSA